MSLIMINCNKYVIYLSQELGKISFLSNLIQRIKYVNEKSGWTY